MVTRGGTFIYLSTELPPLTQHWAGDGDTVSGAEAGGQGHSLQASIYSPSTGILGLLERRLMTKALQLGRRVAGSPLVSLGKLRHLSEPWSLHLQNGESDRMMK